MNQQEIYDAAHEMFNTTGWKLFMEDIANNITNLRIENVEDEKGFWIAKGQLNVLHSIAGYENMMRAAEEQAEADDAEDI